MDSDLSDRTRTLELIRRIHDALKGDDLSMTSLKDGTGVLLDLDGRKVFSFNETGMAIMGEISLGAPDPETLAMMLATKFSVAPNQALADAEVFLSSLGAALSPEASR